MESGMKKVIFSYIGDQHFKAYFYFQGGQSSDSGPRRMSDIKPKDSGVFMEEALTKTSEFISEYSLKM